MSDSFDESKSPKWVGDQKPTSRPDSPKHDPDGFGTVRPNGNNITVKPDNVSHATSSRLIGDTELRVSHATTSRLIGEAELRVSPDIGSIMGTIDKKMTEIIGIEETCDLCIPTYISKSEKKKILVLSGGGVKGIAFVGALCALTDRDLLTDIHTYAGTSIGALILFLLNIGYTPNELYEFIKNFDFMKLKSFNLSTFLNVYGLDNGEKIKKFLVSFLMAKNLPADITFKQLYEKTNKYFIITSVNVNERRAEYFSYKTHPTMSVVMAVRMSIAIPFIFTPVKYNDCIYVDGGCIDNFPYRLFNNSLDDIIGIYITEPPCKTQIIDTIESYAVNVMYSIIYGFAEFIGTDSEHNIIKIEIGDVTAIAFDLSLSEKNRLYDIGYDVVYKYQFH